MTNTGQGNAGTTAAPGLPPADQKLQLEIEKLRQEMQALALRPTDGTGGGQSKPQLEINKLNSDLLKAKAEAAIAGKTPTVEWVKTWGSLLAAAAAIFTLLYAVQTRRADDDYRFRSDAGHLIDSLGDSSEAKRTAAAIALQPYMADPRTQALTIGALAYALGVDTSLDAQQAMADSLVKFGEPALGLLRKVVSQENAIVSVEFDKVGDACKDLSPAQANALTRLRARQSAVILAATAISRITKSAVDLSGAHLKCYQFDGLVDQFDRAKFADAVLTGASFYRKSLKNADLTDAEAINAEFTFADLSGATVSNKTDFSGALMDCVALIGVKGLNENQLRATRSLQGARLDPVLAAALGDRINPPGAKPCEY
jgi:Pentapeptide repeats (8 copies)